METWLVFDLQLWTIISKEVHVASSVGWVLLVTCKDNQPGGKKKNMEQQMNLCNGQKGWCHLGLVCHHDASFFLFTPL